jgi:hypothetical protein
MLDARQHGGRTRDPFLASIAMAQMFNRVTGMSIAPWDVDGIDDIWLDAVFAVAHGARGVNETMNEVEQVKARWRQSLGYRQAVH